MCAGAQCGSGGSVAVVAVAAVAAVVAVIPGRQGGRVAVWVVPVGAVGVRGWVRGCVVRVPACACEVRRGQQKASACGTHTTPHTPATPQRREWLARLRGQWRGRRVGGGAPLPVHPTHTPGRAGGGGLQVVPTYPCHTQHTPPHLLPRAKKCTTHRTHTPHVPATLASRAALGRRPCATASPPTTCACVCESLSLAHTTPAHTPVMPVFYAMVREF